MALPSMISVPVGRLRPCEWRVLGMPAAAAAGVLGGAALLSSGILALFGVNEWVNVTLNLLALIVPAVVVVGGTSTTLAILRASRRWEREFTAGLEVAVDRGTRIENLAEVLLGLQQGRPCHAVLRLDDRVAVYTALPGIEEVVFLRGDGIAAEWAEMNAALEPGA